MTHKNILLCRALYLDSGSLFLYSPALKAFLHCLIRALWLPTQSGHLRPFEFITPLLSSPLFSSCMANTTFPLFFLVQKLQTWCCPQGTRVGFRFELLAGKAALLGDPCFSGHLFQLCPLPFQFFPCFLLILYFQVSFFYPDVLFSLFPFLLPSYYKPLCPNTSA